MWMCVDVSEPTSNSSQNPAFLSLSLSSSINRLLMADAMMRVALSGCGVWNKVAVVCSTATTTTTSL